MSRVINNHKVDFNSMLEAMDNFHVKEKQIVKRIVKKLGKKIIKTMVANDGKVWRLAVVRDTRSLVQVAFNEIDQPVESDYDFVFVHINHVGEAERWAKFDRYDDIAIPRPHKFTRDFQFVCCVGGIL